MGLDPGFGRGALGLALLATQHARFAPGQGKAARQRDQLAHDELAELPCPPACPSLTGSPEAGGEDAKLIETARRKLTDGTSGELNSGALSRDEKIALLFDPRSLSELHLTALAGGRLQAAPRG